MFYELMTYDLAPGTTADFVEVCRSRGLLIRGEKYGRLEGFWRVDVGRQHQVMHLWSHATIEARQVARQRMAEDKAWQTEFLPLCLPLMVEFETRFMSALRPIAPPPAAGGVYEICFTTTRPLRGRGWFERLMEEPSFTDRGIHCAGAWQTIAGNPYEIVTLWWYSTAAARQEVQEALEADPAWRAAAATLASLVVREDTSLLAATAFSPLR